MFTSVIRLDPTFAEGWNKRAMVHWLMGIVSDSMKDSRRTLILERDDMTEAVSAFEAVLKISPKSGNAKLKVLSLHRGIQKEGV